MLEKVPLAFVSIDIDTVGQICPQTPSLNSFLYVILIGSLSQESQIRVPAIGATALAVDSINPVLPLEACKTAT